MKMQKIGEGGRKEVERNEKDAGYKFHACKITSYYQSTGQSTNEYPTPQRKEWKKRKETPRMQNEMK